MKTLNLITLFLLITISGFGQTNTKFWNETFSINSPQDGMCYFQSGTGDISGYYGSMTFEFVGLGANDTVKFDVGGSNNYITVSDVNPIKTSFVGFTADSLPYYFKPSKCTVTTKHSSGTDVSYEKTVRIEIPYGFLRPAFKLTTYSDTVFTLKLHSNFSK